MGTVGGRTYNSGGYLKNPSRSAQIAARNAGALTNREARSMGLRNIRGGRFINDEEEELGLFHNGQLNLTPAIKWMNSRSSKSHRRRELEDEENLDYSYGGRIYTNGGYLKNPSRSAQIAARNAGALTNREARSMGLRNIRVGRYIREEEY